MCKTLFAIRDITAASIVATVVHDYHVDTFVMGDDWEGEFDFLREEEVEVVYLPRTPEISTTQIKRDLNDADLAAK